MCKPREVIFFSKGDNLCKIKIKGVSSKVTIKQFNHCVDNGLGINSRQCTSLVYVLHYQRDKSV